MNNVDGRDHIGGAIRIQSLDDTPKAAKTETGESIEDSESKVIKRSKFGPASFTE